jgi:formate dehydrogenase major subunit
LGFVQLLVEHAEVHGQEILARIFLRVRELYQKEGGVFPDPILNLAWNYTDPFHRSFAELAKEINGRALSEISDPTSGQTIKAGQQLPGFAALKDDGSTLCGNWLYCGSWTEAGAMTQRRGTDDPSGLGVYPNWAWSWPANRRVMYNRASCESATRACEGNSCRATLPTVTALATIGRR